MSARQIFPIFVLFLFASFGLVEPQSSPLQIKSERGFPKNPTAKNNGRRIIPNKIAEIDTNYRLPITVVPTHYSVEILPILDELPPVPADFEEFTAPGQVRILVTCVEPSNTITLHKSPILFVDNSSIWVTRRSDNEDMKIIAHDYDEDKDFYKLTLENALELGVTYQIHALFVAPINDIDQLDGLYRSFYTRPGSDEKIYLAATQMESVSARQVFLCFDEPNLKATFDITIGRKEAKHKALSNSELIKPPRQIADQPGWVWDDFETTQKMSTYLVAFVVSDFGYAEAPAGLYRLPVKVYAAPHLIDEKGGDFAAETSARQLAFFEKHFEINYTMHKMDSVAVQHFAAGAMENWGINIYRPVYLLHFDGKTTERSRGLISNILAHELTHQWFGNLVTCEWWSALWLNEGFATFVSYLGWEVTHPEFEPLKFFVNDAFQYSMQVDAEPTESHPVLNDAMAPEEIEGSFDGITYEKAGSLIRMMEGFLGAETLRQALVSYLQEMSYKSASQDDLFLYLNYKAQEENLLPEGGVTIKDVMDTWTLQSSFPLVRVSKFGADRVWLSQERFSESKFRMENKLDTSNLWFIPVALVTQASQNFSDHKPKLWIEPKTALKSYAHNTSTWIMLNPDATGYYRVLYDIPLTQLILQQLEADHSIVSPQSRSQLLDDYLNLGLQKYISVERALELTKYLSKETERIVWEAVLGNLVDMLSRLRDTSAYNEFRKYLAPKLGATLNAIGVRQPPEQKGAIVILRALLLDWACQFDLPECVSYANELFEDWKTSPDPSAIPIPVDIRPIVYCAAVGGINGVENFEFIFRQYESETDDETIKISFLNALGCAKEPSLLESVLDEILAEPGVSRIEASHKSAALRLIANSNFVGRSLTLKFVRRNVGALLTLFTGTNDFIRVIFSISSGMATSTEYQNFEAFIAENSSTLPEELLDEIKGQLSQIQSNISWRTEYEKRLEQWFSENI